MAVSGGTRWPWPWRVANSDKKLEVVEEDKPYPDGFPMIAQGENERSNKDDDAGFVFKAACRWRVPGFCALVAVNLMFLLLTIALGVRGLDPINSDNLGEVGIIIPTDEYQARSNAFERAEDEADFTRAGGKCARQDNANPIALTVLKGSFEDETKGNALTKKGLETLRERERQITEAEGWGDRCALIYAEGYPDCVVAPSLEADNGVGGTYLASDARGCMPP